MEFLALDTEDIMKMIDFSFKNNDGGKSGEKRGIFCKVSQRKFKSAL